MTLWDKIVIAIVGLVSLFSLLFVNFCVFSQDASEVIVSVDGEIYAKYDFKSIKNKENVSLDTRYGHTVIELGKDFARVKSADCPDLKCVKSGKISRANQMIVCVPLHLTVEIRGESNEVDKVTY